MSDLASLSGGDQPIIHVYPPFQKDGQWYGAIAITVRGEPVKIVVSASHALLQAAYSVASNYVQKFVSYGEVGNGQSGKIPQGSLRAKLAELAPYLPQTGLDTLQTSCVRVIQQAAQGCESCVDALQEIDSRAAKGDVEGTRIKSCMNKLLTQAINRKGLIGQVARMSPGQFQSFLGGLSQM